MIQQRKLSVVLFAGGRGASSIVAALKKYEQLSFTVLVNAYDDGLSTGRVRNFVPGMLGPSDVRKNAATMMREDQRDLNALRNLLEMRLPTPFSYEQGIAVLEGLATQSDIVNMPELNQIVSELSLRQLRRCAKYSQEFLRYTKDRASAGEIFDFSDAAIGNLLLAGIFLNKNRDFNATVREYSELCELESQLLNVTDGRNLILVGVKEDGTLLSCEADIVSKTNDSKLKDIFLLDTPLASTDIEVLKTLPPEESCNWLRARSIEPTMNPEAEEALRSADIIIYCPGTQHSSLFPSYLSQGVVEAIAQNKEAEKIFISNILKDHEIQGETASSLTNKLLYYLSRRNAVKIRWDEVVTRFFFQFARSEKSELPQYVEFDQAQFPFPIENVVLKDWEFVPGKHAGGHVLVELISIVNRRLQKKLKPFHHLVSIVVPGLNESKTLREVLHALTLLDLQSLGVGTEVVYVDGGSSDNSVELAKSVRGVRTFSLPKGTKRGQALRFGVEQSSGDIIIFFPSDGEYKVQDLPAIVTALVKNEYRAVFGSRAIKCADLSSRAKQIYRDDTLGYMVGKYGGIILSIASLLVYNRYVSDPLTSIKGFEAQLLKSLNLNSSGVDLDLEVVAKLAKRGEFILEVPVDFSPRTRKDGKKTTLLDGLRALLALVRYRFDGESHAQTIHSHSSI